MNTLTDRERAKVRECVPVLWEGVRNLVDRQCNTLYTEFVRHKVEERKAAAVDHFTLEMESIIYRALYRLIREDQNIE